MKSFKIFVFVTSFLSCTLHSFGQTVDTLNYKTTITSEIIFRGASFSHISMSTDSSNTIRVVDSALGIVAVFKDGIMSVKDSSAALAILLENFLFSMKSQQKQSEKYWAAQDVLNCVTTRGYVLNKDRIIFNKAVVRYKKIIADKRKFDKMRNMDILIKDSKGNAIGWAQQ